MLNQDQQIEQDKKILLVALDFYENGGTIAEVSERTGISTSSIQRYLTGKRLAELLDENKKDNEEKVTNEILEKLKINKLNGNIKGGIISTNKYTVVKGELGKFQGVKR